MKFALSIDTEFIGGGRQRLLVSKGNAIINTVLTRNTSAQKPGRLPTAV